MKYVEKILNSRGRKVIYNVFDEISGEHEESVVLDKNSGAELLKNVEVYKYMEDDGIGVLVFYKEDPAQVHTLLFAV